MPAIRKREHNHQSIAVPWAIALAIAMISRTAPVPAQDRAQDFATAKQLFQEGAAERAKPLAERAWAWARAELPEDNLARAAHAQLVGAVRAALSDNAGSETAYGAALRILERAHGPAAPVLEPVVRALAIVIERQERWEEAEANYRRSLDLRGKQAPPDQIAIADGLVSLSRVLSAQGRDRAAEPPLLRALELRRRGLGDAHPAVLDSIDRLVALQLRIRRRDLAAQWLTQGLSILEAQHGPWAPDVATWLIRRAEIATADLRHDAARADLERAKAIREAAFGPQSPEVAAVWHQLGLDARDEDLAAEALARALAIRDAKLPSDHPELADSLIEVARRLDRARDPGTALELLTRAIPIRERQEGATAGVAGLLRAAGDYAYDSGNPQGAAAFAVRGLSILRSLKRRDAGAEVTSRILLAEALAAGLDGDARNLAASLTQLDRAAETARSAFGLESPQVADVLEALARTHRRAGAVADGINAIEAAIAMRRDRIGAWDPLLAEAQMERARLCALGAETRDCAEEAIRGALRLRMDTFGIDDPRVADTLDLQAELFDAWGRSDAARAARARAAAIRDAWN